MFQPDADFERDALTATALTIPLAEFILPLFAQGKGKYPEMIGTGFLVDDCGSTFLISAAHVLNRARDLYFYVEERVTRMVSGRISRTLPTNDGPRATDHFDVAVLKLEGEGLPPYPGLRKRAMPMSMLLPSALPRDENQYLIVGFPSSKSKANRKDREINSRPVSFRNISAPLSQYDQLGIPPKTHIVLPLDLKETVASDGTIKPFFSPHGLSGSPMFCLSPGWNRGGSTPVVGIVIEHHKNERALVATDIAIVIELIRAAPKG